MLEIAAVAFTTFFATVGPIEAAAIFVGITPDKTAAQRRSLAIRGCIISAGILLSFAFFGQYILTALGISMAALRTAGGILLLLMGIDLVFGRATGASNATEEEVHEAEHKSDIAVFPLATPLIAGPGTMGAVILLMADVKDVFMHQVTVIVMLLLVLVITLLLLLGASTVNKILGNTGLHIITRVFGILLTALAVQFVFEGVIESGMLPIS